MQNAPTDHGEFTTVIPGPNAYNYFAKEGDLYLKGMQPNLLKNAQRLIGIIVLFCIVSVVSRGLVLACVEIPLMFKDSLMRIGKL